MNGLIRRKNYIQQLENMRSFDNLSKFLMGTIGNVVSPNNISKTMKQDKQDIHHNTVEKYIEYLVNSYVFYQVNRFDIKGKLQLIWSMSDPKTAEREIRPLRSEIINGKLCNVISNIKDGMRCYNIGSPTYAYQSNDTVYFYEKAEIGTFKPVWIWSAQEGDIWETLYGVKVRVDSIETVSILEQSMRALYVTYIGKDCYDCGDYTSEYSAFVVENIGDLFYLYGFAVNGVNACDEFQRSYQGLRCYVSPELGTYSRNNRQCNYETITVVQEITKKTKMLQVVYDKATDSFII